MMFSELKDEVRAQIAQATRNSSDPFSQAQLLGITATAPQFLTLHGKRERYRATYRDFFRNWDILLTPVTLTPAFEHISNDISFPARTLQINGEVVRYSRLQVYPGLASLSGQPATAFPWGRTRQGLPIGLQAIGPYLEDRTPITFAALLEREFGGFVPPPGYEE